MQRSITKSIKQLIPINRPFVKEIVQVSKPDKCLTKATSHEHYIDLEISPSLIERWKFEGYNSLHFGAIRLTLTLHGRLDLLVVIKLALLSITYVQSKHAVIGTKASYYLFFVGYYRKFILHFGSIAAPINRLLSKEGFHWSSEIEAAFQSLKQALTTALVLGLLDFTQSFIIECDDSGTGLGAMLMQEAQPIAYFNEAIKGTAQTLSTYEKEMLEVVKSVQKWRPYLLGNPSQSKRIIRVWNTYWNNELPLWPRLHGYPSCSSMTTMWNTNEV